ncbi:MAG: 50S ribosomal protein L24 [Thermoplasmataceae archaeon]
MSIKNTFKVFLSKDLRKRYGIRSFPIAKGDIVTIEAGSRKGEGGKVIEVDHVSERISIEGITVSKADNKQKAFFVDPSNLKITRLDLSRQERLQKIRNLAAKKNITVEEEPEPVESEAKTAEETPETEDSSNQKPMSEDADLGDEAVSDVEEVDEDSSEGGDKNDK